MAVWLKTIGSGANAVLGWTEDVGFRTAKPRIRNGDDLFLYAAGGSKHIFALARAVASPERDPAFDGTPEHDCAWTLRVEYQWNTDVASGFHIDEISVTRNLAASLRRHSHIKLRPDEYKLAYRKLKDRGL